MYYDGHQQPGEQYYNNEANSYAGPTDEPQPSDSVYYDQYANDAATHQQPPVEDFYVADAGLYDESQANLAYVAPQDTTNVDEASLAGAEQMRATNYVVSEQEEDGGGAGVVQLGDQSESDFDFSGKTN